MRVLFLALAVVALGACKGNCRKLSEKLCDCSLNSIDKDSCVRAAAAAEGANTPTPEDELRCAELLSPADGGRGCDCRLAETREGKIRCGLARAGVSDGGF